MLPCEVGPETGHSRAEKNEQEPGHRSLQSFAIAVEALVVGMFPLHAPDRHAGDESRNEAVALGDLDHTIGQKNCCQRKDPCSGLSEIASGGHAEEELAQHPAHCRPERRADADAVEHVPHQPFRQKGGAPVLDCEVEREIDERERLSRR
jgi:hypothetical protein